MALIEERELIEKCEKPKTSGIIMRDGTISKIKSRDRGKIGSAQLLNTRTWFNRDDKESGEEKTTNLQLRKLLNNILKFSVRYSFCIF